MQKLAQYSIILIEFFITEYAFVNTAVSDLLTNRIMPGMHWQKNEADLLSQYQGNGKHLANDDIVSIATDIRKALEYLRNENVTHGAVDEDHIILYKVSESIDLPSTKVLK